MDAIEAAGKKASSLTRKMQQRLISERNSLLKKYGLEKLKSGFLSKKSGFAGVVDSVKKYAYMVLGIKTTKDNFQKTCLKHYVRYIRQKMISHLLSI